MNYKFGLPVEIIFKCGAVKNINKVIKDNNFKKGILISSERFIKSEYGYEIIQLLNVIYRKYTFWNKRKSYNRRCRINN